MNNILISLIIVLFFVMGSCGIEDEYEVEVVKKNFPHEHAGLNWSDASSGKFWKGAVRHCEELGGRVPTISELRTLIQNCPATESGGTCRATDNCLDIYCANVDCLGCVEDFSGKYSVFGDIDHFWSSSGPYENSAFIVSFESGGLHLNLSTDDAITNPVRCVAGYPIDVTDTKNNFPLEHGGLKWSVPTPYTYMRGWDEAVEYCKNLGGRLPTISELRTLIQNCPATEIGGECGVTDSCLSEDDCWSDQCEGCEWDRAETGKYSVFGYYGALWSSSEISESSKRAVWIVYFPKGEVERDNKTDNSARVICVK